MADKQKFYWLEATPDNTKAMSIACEIAANLMVGNLQVVEDIIIEAYKRRTGENISENAIGRVRENLKNIQYIVFDSTYGNKNNIHNVSGTADALFDISEVLNYQMGHDEIHPYQDSKYPMHWNDDVPLVRVKRIVESAQSRNKQLAIFPFEK